MKNHAAAKNVNLIFTDSFCISLNKLSKLIETKYIIVIIGILIQERAKYFGELRKQLKISSRTLSSRLKLLEQFGLITKQSETHGKVLKSKYTITQHGDDFIKVLIALNRWGA
jgi:DNA-binding HxlR family transcriptional regulator